MKYSNWAITWIGICSNKLLCSSRFILISLNPTHVRLLLYKHKSLSIWKCLSIIAKSMSVLKNVSIYFQKQALHCKGRTGAKFNCGSAPQLGPSWEHALTCTTPPLQNSSTWKGQADGCLIETDWICEEVERVRARCTGSKREATWGKWILTPGTTLPPNVTALAPASVPNQDHTSDPDGPRLRERKKRERATKTRVAQEKGGQTERSPSPLAMRG